jgi:hypothetical protein
VFSGGPKEAGGKKISEIPLADCDAKMLFGCDSAQVSVGIAELTAIVYRVQCPGRDYAFAVRQINGPVTALLDAENRLAVVCCSCHCFVCRRSEMRLVFT